MALDKAFFNGLRPESVRGKFYRKTEIDALLKEISVRAELQNSENELLSMKLKTAQNALKEQTDGASEVAQGIISDAKDEAESILAGARSEAESIVAEAKEEAAEILEAARGKSRGLIEATIRQQELAAEKIEESYSAMRAQHEECVDSLKAAWQEFLCGLDTGEDEEPEDEVPADLSEKVGAIADVLSEIETE